MMNIDFNSSLNISRATRLWKTMPERSDGGNNFLSNKLNSAANEANEKRLNLKKRVKDMYNEKIQTDAAGRKVFTGTLQNKQKGYLDNKSTSDPNTEELKVAAKYNFKSVSSKIQRAKTSVSAGQAVQAAKRKVSEIKRKIGSKQGDAKELQMALTHAKRMEMVARKKKHHLEQEELVEHTSKLDERMEKQEDASNDMKNTVLTYAQDKIEKAEDGIFEQREELLDEVYEEEEESGSQITEDMMAQINSMIAEYGEDTLKKLEEEMEVLEDLEILDPHMSEEDLEEVKRKHRSSENKAMVKADMDYLKSMIKYQTQNSAPVTVTNPVSSMPDMNLSIDNVSPNVGIDISV